MLSCFLKGVETYGIPSRVRSDKGKENVLVSDYMIEKRGSERGSMITGSSTHNQRIEHLWADVFHGVFALYYELFIFMEDNELLDPSSALQWGLSDHTTLRAILAETSAAGRSCQARQVKR